VLGSAPWTKTARFETDNLKDIRDFIVRAECVEGSDELYDIMVRRCGLNCSTKLFLPISCCPP
jgi:hypothetical protein